MKETIEQTTKTKERRLCTLSALYGKDNDKTLHFYCNYCGEEMGYEEKRECKAIPDICIHCSAFLGDTDKSVSTCLTCKKPI